MSDETDFRAQLISRTNKGLRTSAAQYALDHQHGHYTSAETWYQMALAAQLCNMDSQASNWIANARTCPDYTPGMEANWSRDDALALIRRYHHDHDWVHLELAFEKLSETERIRRSEGHRIGFDTNEFAADTMAWSRYYLARGYTTEAHSFIKDAWVDISRDTPVANPQYKQNIFFWLTFIGSYVDSPEAGADRARVIRSDSSKRRVQVFQVVNVTPRRFRRRVLNYALSRM